MSKLVITLLLIFSGIFNTYGQSDYFFNKWKAKGEIVTEKILLIMDSTNSGHGKELNDKLGRLISENLKRNGNSASYTFNREAADTDVLMIKFDMVKPAYVKLNTIGADIPLCNRFEIIQINKLPEKQNRLIRTTLAISVDREESGLKQASESLADLISESIKK